MLSLAGKRRKHNEETKNRISRSRKEYLEKHPEKVPYKLNHKSKGESYPEKYFREWLEKENISFIQEYSFGLYSFDFLVNGIIDLEIDGAQHKVDKRVKVSDEKRDIKAKEAGYIVYRISWPDYKLIEDKESFLLKLKNYFNDIKNEYPEIEIKEKRKNIKVIKKSNKTDKEYIKYIKLTDKKCICCGKQLNDRQTKFCSRNCHATYKCSNRKITIEKVNKVIELLKSGMSFLAVGKAFKVSDAAIRKWLRYYNIDPKEYTKYRKK